MNKSRLQQLAGIPITEEYKSMGYGLSTPEQDQRLGKMFSASGDEGMRLLYMWVKQNVISFREFKELATWYLKE